MKISNQFKLRVYDQITPTKVSLHFADPTDTGSANELTEDGNYARGDITFEVVTGKLISKTDVSIKVTSNSTIKFIGYWKGTEFVGSVEVPTSTYGADGVYIVEAGTEIALT